MSFRTLTLWGRIRAAVFQNVLRLTQEDVFRFSLYLTAVRSFIQCLCPSLFLHSPINEHLSLLALFPSYKQCFNADPHRCTQISVDSCMEILCCHSSTSEINWGRCSSDLWLGSNCPTRGLKQQFGFLSHHSEGWLASAGVSYGCR